MYGFYFGGRTGETYLIEVGIDIVYTPFVKVEGRTLFIEFQAFFAQSLFFARCLGVFVTLYELRIARTTFIGRTVDRDDCWQGNYDGFYPAFETTFHGGFPVFYVQNLLGIGDLGYSQFFGDLRAYLSRVAIDGLTTSQDNIIIFDFAYGTR